MIRLRAIELTNVKNVGHGRIDIKDTRFGSGVTGIYGQNGSGKTAVVDALACVRDLMRGGPLAEDSVDLIRSGCDEASVELEFEVTEGSGGSLGFTDELGSSVANGSPFYVQYAFSFGSAEGSPLITAESLSVRAQGVTKRSLLSYSLGSTSKTPTILPDGHWKSLRSLAGREAAIDLAIAQRSDALRSHSKVFSKELERFAIGTREAYQARQANMKLHESERRAFELTLRPLMDSVTLLKLFARSKLEVYRTTRGAALAFNAFSLSAPESGREAWSRVVSQDASDRGFLRDVTFSTSETIVIPLDVFDDLTSAVEVENRVLETIVPGLNVRVRPLNRETMPDGQDGMRVEVLSRRGDVEVPFRSESEGIKKIVSMLGRMIDVYNDDSACLVIDEIDAGVFEFLLGEILQVLLEHGRGQLIFTAHNLRPLECLPSGCIVFTTVNPEARYIRFRGSGKSNNLRNQYLRAINLGGQRERVYEPTDSIDMSMAFYEAGHPVDESFDELVQRLGTSHE